MSERTPSDAVLVERLRSGDHRAFDLIDARYRRPPTRTAEWRLGPARRALAEELVQETFLRAYRSLVAGDREVLLRPWLYRILHNAVVDELRRLAVLDADPDACPQTTAEAAWEAALRRENLREIVGAAAALPDRQRRALAAHVFEGVDHSTIATSLGTTVAAGKVLVNRARTSPGRSRRRLAVAASGPPAAIAPGTWSADPAHSIVLGGDRNAELFGMVRTASLLVSDGAPRARSAALDALGDSRFPGIAFESSAVDIAGPIVQLDGRLTVKGTTLSIIATGELTAGEGDLPLRLTLETLVDRRQFDVGRTGSPTADEAYAYRTRLQVELRMRRLWVP